MNVAIAHHQQLMPGGGLHQVQAVDLRVRIGRLAGQDQADRNHRVFGPQLFYYRDRRIVRAANREQNLVRLILLEKKGAKIPLKLVLRAG